MIADDQPESPSWEGDSRHIVYQTPKGLRRVLADGSPPEPIALDLTWRAAPPPERVVVHAGPRLRRRPRSAARRVRHRRRARHHPQHRGRTATNCTPATVVDAPDETVMPGLIEMHAHLDDGYGGNFGRIWLAYGITSVRIPSINPYAALEQREAFDAGRRPGPRVFFAGDPFDGTPRLLPRRRRGDLGRPARTGARSRVGARRRLLQDLRAAPRSAAEADRRPTRTIRASR